MRVAGNPLFPYKSGASADQADASMVYHTPYRPLAHACGHKPTTGTPLWVLREREVGDYSPVKASTMCQIFVLAIENMVIRRFRPVGTMSVISCTIHMPHNESWV